ncbi:Uncharacterised protein [Oligella ureolytica]|uniref:Uncharacterized protein n=2 Tax=Alcaligenaceae TaxID=506 RepID=A0A095YKS5_9BURK|nr:hypothetical protein HMPREF2130_12020 [Oligella urethralis DNF00040]OFS86066.1 hypothetical protein HMPREF3144_04745 [Oligella sp. HMSC05A10]OFV47992.1 hypothetical protein HMPREF3179_06855 [Oligella sp. HMSC09E12]PMC16478.1 hypothetical protein CJ230_09040 [Oligella urethralis]SUA57450.1 Uncharacterised protein [Oligella ureolytica]
MFAMKVTFKTYFFCMLKALFVSAIVFCIQILVNVFLNEDEVIEIWDVFSLGVGLTLIASLVFLIPLIIATLVRFLLNKHNYHRCLSFLINFAVFFTYGYYLFIKSQPLYKGTEFSEHEKLLILSMVFYTSIFLITSEIFISSKVKKLSLSVG